MPKMFVFEIGYNKYAVPIEDGPMTLQVLQTMRLVESKGWNKPHVFSDTNDHVFTSLAVAEVLEPEPPEPPEPPAPPPQPEPPPEPLRIGHTPKLAAPPSDLPF